MACTCGHRLEIQKHVGACNVIVVAGDKAFSLKATNEIKSTSSGRDVRQVSAENLSSIFDFEACNSAFATAAIHP
jgi:hypothetical protein